jgi:hypothetical protein
VAAFKCAAKLFVRRVQKEARLVRPMVEWDEHPTADPEGDRCQAQGDGSWFERSRRCLYCKVHRERRTGWRTWLQAAQKRQQFLLARWG